MSPSGTPLQFIWRKEPDVVQVIRYKVESGELRFCTSADAVPVNPSFIFPSGELCTPQEHLGPRGITYVSGRKIKGVNTARDSPKQLDS